MNKAIKIVIWGVVTSFVFYMFYFGGYRPGLSNGCFNCFDPLSVVLTLLVISSVPIGLLLLTPEPNKDSKYYNIYKNFRFFGIIILSSLFLIFFTYSRQQQ